MSDPTTQPTTEVALDPELARNAYERFVGAARDLSPSEVRPVTADHAAVARVAHAAAGELAKAGVAVRFEGLEKEKYLDPRHRQDLSELALALFHAATLEAAAGVGESTALVPGDRVRLANETKARMSKVLEYFFAEDEEVWKQLKDIRRGVGYLDLASDLNRLSALYKKHQAVIELDVVHYREGDSALASSLALELLTAVRKEAGEAADLAARIFSLLRVSYDEVRGAALYVFRADESLREKFPALLGAARRPPTRRPRPA